MAKKDSRQRVILECTVCKRRNYTTTKNKRTQVGRVEYRKYCPWCRAHHPHKETR